MVLVKQNHVVQADSRSQFKLGYNFIRILLIFLEDAWYFQSEMNLIILVVLLNTVDLSTLSHLLQHGFEVPSPLVQW